MRNNQAMTSVAHRIGVLALDGVVALDLGTPAQVFGTARTDDGTPLYTVATCTPGGRPVHSSAGFQVLPRHGLELLADVETVIVPGIHSGDPLDDGTVDPAVAEALRAAHDRGARVMSICTGAFVLAAAGLLDGRPATTHWAYASRFRRLHPTVDLDPDVLFIDDGPVLTSAGVAAGIDLCLHVVRTDHGAAVANRSARRCVVPPWRDGGQAQYIERPVPAGPRTGTAATREWARQRLHEPVTLRDLAGHARMSVRTFTRHFRSETGLSPAQWLLGQRTDHARLLLETTDLSVDQVAHRSGFGTAAALRQQLQLRIGVSPSAYRRTFRHSPT
ncbi:GlxA family transcriptional regulator [Micromonospora siamensis]|uniref:Transcriptional regulator GlxA family, contains an amidase domain and an AraC-type DNA-binding HTH domain n=1 Tax=Micromonospora siamensis TaxID=299152 RepID=A0A1C5HIB8_9ACTN|nr:helix-turn-helix domain-containing protein [Micromonospora siamensis]SCG45281.1 Transcriptional regulator GlxA family, contains an amidase domain and an AraC-type DNA-binding HTH domain [Micromonospora siamensis]